MYINGMKKWWKNLQKKTIYGIINIREMRGKIKGEIMEKNIEKSKKTRDINFIDNLQKLYIKYKKMKISLTKIGH